MFTKVFRIMLPGVVLLNLFLLATSSAFAATSTPLRKSAGVVNAPCQTLEVHLHGTQPATTRCLDKPTTSSTSGVTPQLTVGCSTSAELDLYWDANWTGVHLCFIGSGIANMNAYVGCGSSGCRNWDNQTSSYYTGCSPVTFFTGYNGDNNSSHIGEPAYHRGNFTPGAVPNDSLSSLYISNGCTA